MLSIEGKATSWACALTGHEKSLHWGDQNNFLSLKNQDDNPTVRQAIPSSWGKMSDFTIKHYMQFHQKRVHSGSSAHRITCFYLSFCCQYSCSSATLEIRIILFWLHLCMSVHFQSYFIAFFSHLERESAPDSPTSKLGIQVPYINFIHYTGLLERAYISFLYTYTFSEDLLYNIFQRH